MPSTTTNVGGTTLPVPAGALNSSLDDPAVKGLLDYLAFWIKNTLDTKLANMTGPVNKPVTDAAPAANRYPFNPESLHVKMNVPALFVWWDGKSQAFDYTLVKARRVRELSVAYVFDEVRMPAGLSARAGLIAAVDACFAKAEERGDHPAYGYNGDPLGTPIAQSLQWIDWQYLGGQEGFYRETLSESLRTSRDEGGVQRGYPALTARFRISELIAPDTLEDPTDVLGDSVISIAIGDGESTAVSGLFDRELPGPDGSEQP